MKIVVLDGYTLNPGDLSWDSLNEIGELTVYDRTIKEADAIIKAIADAEIVFTNKTPITKDILEKVPSVKYIGVLATGYNVVDVVAATASGITVTNIPAYSTPSVAQMTFALLLEMCNQVGKHNDTVWTGQWSNSPDFCFWNTPLIELAGKTLGIIGFGRIGKATAKIAQAFGMKVLVYTRNRTAELKNTTCQYADFEDLLAHSDVISLHCPLTEATRGIINRDTISRMKDGVLIVNTARGPLIVEVDLVAALNSGKVAGAALDVVSVEPIEKTNELFNAKNCIITPHIAWAPKESRERLMNITVENLKAFIDGRPVNVVYE
ncbi:MAG: D-2-hydroxyacid dehydrogenase [Bacteroidetes bacterium]|nr:D-2-hydroxyacid dehydrogenase [Bacteroidota bacterium]